MKDGIKTMSFLWEFKRFLERITFIKSDEYYYTKCSNCGGTGQWFFNLPICMSYYEKNEAEEIVSKEWHERYN